MSKNQSNHFQKDEQNQDIVHSEPERLNDSTENEQKKGTLNEANGLSFQSTDGSESTQNQTDQGEEQAVDASPEEKIAELELQVAETRDQLLRKAAEFENFRKRMNQEKQQAIEYANQSLLLDLIPIIDDFERALQSAESSKDFNSLLDGITMIEKRMTSQLETKWGLKRFSSAGELFDPNLHEAVMMEKSSEISEAIVSEDFMKGYFLKDRVIRAAKVKVLMPG